MRVRPPVPRRNPWTAWAAGAVPSALAHDVAVARDDFLSSGRISRELRRVVAESWRRSLRGGARPDGSGPPVDLLDDDLEEYRSSHPLALIMPVVRRLLVSDAVDADLIVAVSDAEGRLLWVEGAGGLRRQAEGMNFVAGARWSESAAGTNAPGTALALDHAISIFGAEHLAGPVTPWSCSAAPIHAPDGRLLGALDLTGGDEVAAPHTLRLVSAAAAAVEAELRVHELVARAKDVGTTRRRRVLPTQLTGAGAAATGSLAVLGRAYGELEIGRRRHRLSMRHSELLLVLAESPAGLSADQLDAALHEDQTAGVTARAEISRVRGLLGRLGGPEITSRPYRLVPELETDAGGVRASLGRSDFAAGLAAYEGPLLPGSQAPAVASLREELHADLRNAILGSRDAELIWSWAHRPENALDRGVWQACLEAVPADSPRQSVVRGRLRMIDRGIGLPPLV